jgi:hypothetical protein
MMEEQEFFKKLENGKLEAKEVPSHRSQLRASLLSPKEICEPVARNRINKGFDKILNIFTSRQPVWRVMVASALVISLLGVFFVSRSSMARAPEEAQVTSILQNDSQFMNAFGGEEFTSVKVLSVRDNVAIAAVSGSTGNFLTFVDLSTKKVTHYNGNREGFTEAEKADIAQILSNDPKTKALLGLDAVLKYDVVSFGSPAFHNSGMTYATTAAALVSLSLNEPVPFILEGVTFYENHFSIWIDLDRQEISPIDYATYAFLTDTDLIQVLDVLRSDSRTNSLLDSGAIFLSISNMNTRSTITVGIDKTNTITSRTATIILQLGDKYYQASVDVTGNKVTSFAQIGKP